MYSNKTKILLLICILIMLVSACEFPPSSAMADEESEDQQPQPTATYTHTPEPQEPQAVEESAEPEPVEPTEVPTPTFTPTPEVIGPDYTDGFNPLTGLLEGNLLVLFQKPLMVAISNFPPSARPQSGMSTAAHVWETYIGEGATRFLVVFYGDYIAQLQGILQNQLDDTFDQLIQPIRSGRVVFEDIKTLYPGGILITAGASAEVGSQLSNRQNFFGDNPDDINNAGLDGDDLGNLAGSTGDPLDYASLTFGPPAPGGSPADFLRIVYNVNNHVGWEYDPDSGTYLRYQDRADSTGELYPATDALTGEQLGFENVVVMWARHNYVKPTVIEVELLYVKDRKGLLFRDGEVYDILWSSMSGEFKIYDQDGNIVPLKPGKTFFQVVSYASTWKPDELLVRFH